MAKHDTQKERLIAQNGTILRCVVGSTVHGTSVSNQDDRDEMGICLEPPEYVTGLGKFEQYEWHTAWDRPGGRANRSGPGDLDITIYSARKWMRLALAGNPTVLLPLFAPEYVTINGAGLELIDHADRILSRNVGLRFAGYMRAQKARLTGARSKNVNRPELVEAFGFDTKFAGHVVRLGMQGVEIMETGRLSLPMLYEQSQYVREVRTGKHSLEDILIEAEYWESELNRLIDSPNSAVRPTPDYEWANHWLHKSYTNHWEKISKGQRNYK